MAAYGPRIFGKRLIHMPPFVSRKEKVLSLASMFLFARGMMVYSIFVTLKWTMVWFYIGTAIYLLGLIMHTVAMINFAHTSPDHPVVKGVYRLSRHPMQLVSIAMWMGVGIATASWVILAACGVQLFLSRPFLIAQERYCLDRYGDLYREYMRRTPRYFFIRFCLQNNGRLSAWKRASHFDTLSDEEIARMEQSVQSAYGKTATRDG
jgi:protein-S-isoprenylcysteine O-methyltransferase Ste14